MEARGGVVAQPTCKKNERTAKRDGGEIATLLGFDTEPGATPKISVQLFLVGVPRVGLQQAWPAGAPVYARAHVVSSGVEWEAISRVHGTIDVTLKSVRARGGSGEQSYEVHGVLEAVLPYTNLPVGDPTSSVTVRVNF
jgi:hypothetical protein